MNRFTQTKVHIGGVRPVSLLLMVIFTVCAFALMWAAVGCLDRISESSSDAVDGLAAAQLTANRIRSAEGTITVYTDSNGNFEKMTVSRRDGYENVMTCSNGLLSEALIPEGSGASAGEGIFEIKGLTVTDCGDTAKITVTSRSGNTCTVYTAAGAEMTFLTAEDD